MRTTPPIAPQAPKNRLRVDQGLTRMGAPIVTGVADHTGWAVLVCVSARHRVPEVVDRRRVELIEPGLPRQPYEHDTLDLNTADAERLVRAVRESAAHRAERALSLLQSSLGALGQIVSIALREPTLARLPRTVAEAHASRSVMVRADGMLYHDALCGAAASLGIGVAMFARGAERQQAAEAVQVPVERMDQFLDSLRTSLGPPWQQDHQAATARAIAALGKSARLRLP
jgi:hypothetical protein